MTIGEKIRISRKKKKITQPALASRLGKSVRIIQKYESNEVIPSLDIVEQIASILEVSPADFMEWEDWAEKDEYYRKEFQAFETYLKKSGYLLDFKMTGVSDSTHTKSDGSVWSDEEYYEIKLTDQNGKSAVFDQDEFAKLQNDTNDFIKGWFYINHMKPKDV